jgi:hypothetical protein
MNVVRIPPSTNPKLKPEAPVALKMLRALLRSGPSAKVVVIIEIAEGSVNAAPMPCNPRVSSKSHPLFASPQMKEARPKSAAPMRKMRRRPSRSAARPPSNRKPP